MRRNTGIDPSIPIYFPKTYRNFGPNFKPNSEAGSVLEQAKFLMRMDKVKPKNEQTLEYYVQDVHEEILRDTLVPQFEDEKEKLQKMIDDLNKKLDEEKALRKQEQAMNLSFRKKVDDNASANQPQTPE